MKKFAFLIFSLLFTLQGSLMASAIYDQIIIVIGDHVITKNEVEVNLNLRLQNTSNVTASQRAELEESIVNGLIEETLLDIKADEMRIQISDEMVEDEINRLIKMNKLTRGQFEEVIERQQMTMSDFRENRKKQMRRESVISQEIRSKINIDEEKLKDVHENSDNESFLVHARHILARTGSSPSEADLKAAREKIQKVKQLIQEGLSFEAAAVQYSEDPSVTSNKGDLGFFRREDMVSEFSVAAFSLNPGELSDPIKTAFGFHLIEVLERKKQQTRPFSEVREDLYQREYQKRFQEALTAYIAELKKSVEIVRR